MVPPPLGWTAPPWPTSSFPHPLLLPIGKPLFRLPTPASSLCTCFLPPCELGLSYRLQPFCPGTRLGPSCQVWAGSQTHVQPDFRSEQAPGQRPCPGPPPSGSRAWAEDLQGTRPLPLTQPLLQGLGLGGLWCGHTGGHCRKMWATRAGDTQGMDTSKPVKVPSRQRSPTFVAPGTGAP